jgi:hypothetical protein
MILPLRMKLFTASVTALTALLLAAVATVAHATGMCEDVGVRYAMPTLYSEASDAFAISARLAGCEVRDDGGSFDEERGTIDFVELRDVNGTVIDRLSAARGDDAQRLEAGAGTFAYVAKDKQAAALTARGFAPFITRSPAKQACSVRAVWKATAQKEGGWPSGTLFIEVRAGTRKLLRWEVGDMAEARRGDEVVLEHFIAKRRKIALLTLRPTCGGPPPGYFSADDAGSCYHQDFIETSLVDATSRALARCFTTP